ncbi:hypothetical protein INT45_002933 [Circinella minor]|uniref:Uncharacterized protein n=1 Tax=Circinella minor TaxID=1195481 RepID=A0A8H7VRI3_9FUNG|nr:hypothetical protein INT45_002933 [Circinella minor]
MISEELSPNKTSDLNDNESDEQSTVNVNVQQALNSVIITYLETGAAIANDLMRNKAALKRIRQDECDRTEVVEVDDVFVGNSSESVGTRIKNEALKLYPSYNNLDHTKKAVVELGLNSILDVFIGHTTKKNFIHPPQSYLFSDYEWKELSLKFNHMSSEYNVIVKYEDKIKKIEKYAKGDLRDARQHTYMAEMKSTRDDESILYAIYTHFLGVLEYHQYMFLDYTDITDLDFGVKLWGPMLEKLFRNTNLRCKWGESVADSTGVTESRGFTVDIRDVRDTLSRRRKEADQANVELGRKNLTISKASSDRIKLLIESKCVMDRLAKKIKHFKHHDIAIPALQFAGPQVILYSLQLGSKGLYVGIREASGTVPRKAKELDSFREVVKILFKFKRTVLDVYEHILTSSGDDDKDDINEEGRNEDYKSWVRGTWVPPRGNIKTRLLPIPDILVGSDL